MKLKSSTTLRAGLLAATLMGTMVSAHASTVFETTGTMFGDAQFTSYTFDILDTSVGYSASLMDYAFPSSFDALGLAIAKGASLMGSVMGSGSFSFSPVEAGTYTALVFGDPGGAFNAGSYGITVAAAVPEAETWALLMVGLGLVGMVARRRDQKALLINKD